ncbi:MAG: metal-sensing transcriptional repressor [Bacteroidales bacterium]|jgi:hypothetical protein
MPAFVYNRNLLKRLHYLQGQLHGIENMMLEHRPPEDINIQLSAVEHAFHNLVYEVFFEFLQKNAALLFSRLLDKFAGCPKIFETLDNIRKNFHTYTVYQLPSIINILCELDHIGDKKEPE